MCIRDRYWVADHILDHFQSWIKCPDTTNGALSCLGISACYRMSFALAALFVIIFLAQLFRNDLSKMFNEGMWIIKFAVVLGIFIAVMYLSNDFFEKYVIAAKVIGAIFMIAQAIMLVDLFWIWSENLIHQFDTGNSIYKYILLLMTLILYAGTITLIVFNFIWFYKQKECKENLAFLIVNIFLVVILTGLTISGIVVGGSLFAAGCISAYITYLTFSSLSNNTSKKCNEFYNSKNIVTQDIIINIFIIILWMIYFSQRSTKQFIKYIKQEDASQDLELQNEKSKQQVQIQPEAKDSNDDCEYKSGQWISFHLLMIIVCIHISNAFTNWSTPSISEKKAFHHYKPNIASFIIKIACSYLTFLIYIWTLIAPKILKSRQFRQDI
eukprot:TRINITY_DN985_c0_g1_i3.p1 TRINITY_DN985_c0_g1~~TRINITY_DN985_c0_g1_i3.p1  ORF type:complete len:383 (+),score=44.03 TRINITY_DN985_c0_g1_i3:66-1214(+)